LGQSVAIWHRGRLRPAAVEGGSVVSEHIAEAVEERTGNVVTRNPNATVALGSGSGLGAVVVWIAQASGAGIPPEIAAIIGGGIAAVALFIGRNGIQGAVKMVWRGKKG
jgi:hypothetical protein